MNFRNLILALVTLLLFTSGICLAADSSDVQYAAFPKALEHYPTETSGTWDTIITRAKADPFNVAASIVFFLAILHTFCASFFNHLAHQVEEEHQRKLKQNRLSKPNEDHEEEVSFKATVYHFLGEIEAVFGIWVIALAGVATYFYTWEDFKLYVAKDRVFTEPLFVFVIMAMAASRPVLRFAEKIMACLASLGKGSPGAWWFTVLVLAPILGSFITEPAAMTIGALILAKKFYRFKPSTACAYATLGLLFVNISLGGTLTHFAAPPVLMVAAKWGWDTPFMFLHFGWKSCFGILLNTLLYYLFFRKELKRMADAADGAEDGVLHPSSWQERETKVPTWITIAHLLFLAFTVYTAHYPALFMGGFLFFLAFIQATRHHQNDIALRGPMLVGFFLAGLVIHGGCQVWWIDPIIRGLSDKSLMIGSVILTGFNDNAAITYLASQVEGISDTAKYAVVSGAVIGGGLTVIANAPNPAGQNILSKFFTDGVSPIKLFMAALLPTLIFYFCFLLLPHPPMEVKKVEKAAVESPASSLPK